MLDIHRTTIPFVANINRIRITNLVRVFKSLLHDKLKITNPDKKPGDTDNIMCD